MPPRFLYILDFCMARTGYYHRLGHTLRLKIPPYFIRRLVPVHEWHLAVHDDETVAVVAALHGSPHFVQGILPVVRLVDYRVYVWESGLVEQDPHSESVHRLVVDDEDPSLDDIV